MCFEILLQPILKLEWIPETNLMGLAYADIVEKNMLIQMCYRCIFDYVKKFLWVASAVSYEENKLLPSLCDYI